MLFMYQWRAYLLEYSYVEERESRRMWGMREHVLKVTFNNNNAIGASKKERESIQIEGEAAKTVVHWSYRYGYIYLHAYMCMLIYTGWVG